MSETNVELALLRGLTKAGVRYALLHGLDKICDGNSSDVDVVVAQGDLDRCLDVVRQWPGYWLAQVLRYEATAYGFVMVRTSPQWQSVILDVCLDYRCRGRVFFRNSELLAGRRLLDGIWCTSPETELAFLLVKKFYEKGTVPCDQRRRIRVLTQEVGESAAARVYESLFGKELGTEVRRAVSCEQWDKLVRKHTILMRALGKAAAIKYPLGILSYWTQEIGRIVDRVRRPVGITVALLGPDGVGKSTAAQCLVQQVRGPFRGGITMHFRPRLLGRDRVARPSAMAAARPSWPRWAALAKLLLYLCDYWLGYVLVVRPGMCRAKLVVFDRYVDDIVIDPPRYRYDGPRWWPLLMQHLAPKPDLCVVLLARPQVLVKRRLENNFAEAAELVEQYAAWAAARPRTVLVWAEAEVAAVVKQLRELILKVLVQRCKARVCAGGAWLKQTG